MIIEKWDFSSFDGVNLSIHEMGEGVPVVLLHGLFSNADTNWIKFGHAAVLAEAGFRVIMPDLRAHGQSDEPHDPDAYPKDVLVRDIEALIAYLELETFNLGGFSLGARTNWQREQDHKKQSWRGWDLRDWQDGNAVRTFS